MKNATAMILEAAAPRQEALRADLAAAGHDVIALVAGFDNVHGLIRYMVAAATKLDVVVIGNSQDEGAIPGMDEQLAVDCLHTAMPGVTILNCSDRPLPQADYDLSQNPSALVGVIKRL